MARSRDRVERFGRWLEPLGAGDPRFVKASAV
jgi:hypothetical protein